MSNAPPTTGLHHVTNICTDMVETRAFDFSDPDGLTFEIATEGPGFGVDESRRLSSANQNSPSSGGVDEEEPGSEVIDPYAEGYPQKR